MVVRAEGSLARVVRRVDHHWHVVPPNQLVRLGVGPDAVAVVKLLASPLESGKVEAQHHPLSLGQPSLSAGEAYLHATAFTAVRTCARVSTLSSRSTTLQPAMRLVTSPRIGR